MQTHCGLCVWSGIAVWSALVLTCVMDLPALQTVHCGLCVWSGIAVWSASVSTCVRLVSSQARRQKVTNWRIRCRNTAAQYECLFCRAMLCISEAYAIMWCLCVCLFVCLCVCHTAAEPWQFVTLPLVESGVVCCSRETSRKCLWQEFSMLRHRLQNI